MNHLLTATIYFSCIIKKKLLGRFLLCSTIMFLSFSNATSQDITIEYGNKVSGEMPADQTYTFSFTGVDGDNIRIKSYLNGGYGKIVLISPTNSIVKEIDTGKQYNDLELTLDNSGVYKIKFSHDFAYSRNYSVGIYKLNDPDYSTPMEYGKLYSGEIGVCGMNIYSFSGTAGENIRIKNYLNDGYGAIEVRSPNNDTLRFVDNRKEFNDIELTLDITGKYQIFVYHDFPYSRDFSISLYKLNDTNYSNQVDFGETYSGSIKRCEMVIYEFTGSQNDSVVIQSYVQGGKGIIEVRSQDSDTIVLNNIISE